MRITCPCCGEEYPVDVGFADDDGKRLAALLAEMDPVLGRAVIGYLRLFRPAKQALRTARAVKLVAELDVLVRAGTVCRDERGGVRRPATPAHWAEGIEQMLAQRERLTLPLTTHHYLRAIVFGLADQADAAAERQREETVRRGQHRSAGGNTDLYYALSRIQGEVDLGLIDASEAERRRAAARKEHA